MSTGSIPASAEHEQVVQPELKGVALLDLQVVSREDSRGIVRLEAVVLVERHAVDDAQEGEDVEDRIHERGRCRDDAHAR